MSKTIFQNHQKAVAQFLHECQQCIDISVCWFSDPYLFSILLKKVKAGIVLRLIVQFDQANFNAKGLLFTQLADAGGSVQVFCQDRLLHHKFAIADKNKVLTGSYNWTRTRHEDNVLILENHDLAKIYGDEFDQLWKATEPLAMYAKKKPPPPNFHQLFQPIVWNSYDLRHAIVMGAKVWLTIFNKNEMEIWEKCLQMQRHFYHCKSDDFFEKNNGVWDDLQFSKWAEQLNPASKRIMKNYCLKMRLNDVLIASDEYGKLLGAGLVGSAPQPSHLPEYAFARYVQWFEFSDQLGKMENLPKRKFGLLKESGLRVVSYLE